MSKPIRLRFVDAPSLCAAALAAFVGLLTGEAIAGDKALAESLFDEGRKLLAAGKNAEACEKFAASQAEDPSPGTLINLGKCNEAQGRTATAWAAYKEAIAVARSKQRSKQEEFAAERVAAIEPTLSKLQVQAPASPVEGLVVKRGEVPLSAASLGIAVPVDPGEHTISASAPGRRPWTKKVRVEGAGATVTVRIPALDRSETPADAGVTPIAPDGSSRESSPIPAYILIGAGGAVIVAGGIFGYLAIAQAKDAEDDPTLCPEKKCTADGRAEIDSAETKALISNVAIGAGVVSVGIGAYLLLARSSAERPPSHARSTSRMAVVPVVGEQGGALMLSGRW